MRVPVISSENIPLMPTKPSRARRWIKSGIAIGKFNKLGIFYVQLIVEPSDTQTQEIVVGLDPGKMFSGVAVQSQKYTLQMLHLVLPFKTVKDRMEQRAMMRRSRRGRRINRKIPYNQRSHRQARFDNRRGSKLPPSIRANKDLEYRSIKLLSEIYPAKIIVVEVVEAQGSKSFSPVMVGQRYQINRLSFLSKVELRKGWETSNLRKYLGLHKEKSDKSLQIPETHAVDAVTLASSQFVKYQAWEGVKSHGASWIGNVIITNSQFTVLRRPPISRRQLHLMVPSKGGNRRKYGGTTTRHGFRKGDFVEAIQGKKSFFGWISGDTEKQVSVSDCNWKRLGQCTAKKVRLIKPNTGLIVLSTRKMFNLMASPKGRRQNRTNH
ncbi:RRXRR domain-containing protein [Nostoc sp. UHCC 0252]|uniref:RRXRR domain-containing protein n=1 Tax=Nostoc sp. UHCC 0252 TaxID=3110241 RepID=UPI002B1F6FAF|nr:RRXRR domain-containing protein [Nostoc sp. UHCC 0252]MEA5605557.1 RRXRR domain-containing protein [Nostoc sp. UHCC 0252]